ILLVLGAFLVSCTNPQLGAGGEEKEREPETSPAARTETEKVETDTFEGEIALERVSEVPIEISDSLSESADMSIAVDDYVWQELTVAHDYYTMGVAANRETSWEEAQYYFEKSLAILGELDLDAEADSLSPEAVKYTSLLADIITNYRMTLLSLGHLPGDVSPDALMARFSEINNIRIDSAEFKRLESYAGERTTYNVPIVFNERVKKCVLYYQTVARDAVERYLHRSTKYMPMIDSVFAEYGLPSDIKYLALVESGYNPHAYSWARAMGLWQFISSTGRLYGLHRSWWFDERKDPIKATVAAARFLTDLYDKFGSWELAMAAYNGGPGRVRKQIRRQKTNDFWKLKLRKQTMDYVPFFMAATMISKDPERFGFRDIDYLPEWEYDVVAIDRCLDLKVVAGAIGCSVSDVKELNPELLRRFTPPNMKTYNLRIPKGKSGKFWAAYDDMPSSKETSFVRHKIRRGETVSTIARKYGVSQYAIFEANNLSRRSKIYAGKTLIVPVPNDKDYARQTKRDYKLAGDVYVVRAGDTVWDIARAFGTTPEKIRRLNKLDRRARIYVGQKLHIGTAGGGEVYAQSGGSGNNVYVVKKGDTLWDIARRFGTTTSVLRKLNGLGRRSRIYPGQNLLVAGTPKSTGGYRIYTVKRGDTLSDIANLFNTTVSRLMAWNDVTNPRKLRVGDKLKIYMD
ncbi:MAG: LysM peptidoglycan-binding domain-containing protein, partial [Candidatus Zixiibacteriota bacterium]